MGGALGLAITATVANSADHRARSRSGERVRTVALTEGFQDAFLACAGHRARSGAILAAVLISSRDSREHAEAARRGEVEPVAA